MPEPKARRIAFRDGVLCSTITIGGILFAVTGYLLLLASSIITHIEIVSIAKHGEKGIFGMGRAFSSHHSTILV